MKSNIPFSILIASSLAVGAAGLVIGGEHAAVGSAPAAHHQEAPAASATPAVAPAPASFAYHGAIFNSFVSDSYHETSGRTPNFYAWMDHAYIRSGVRYKGKEKIAHLDALLASIKQDRANATDPEARALIEKRTSGFLHRMVKKSIPKFSLDRGFEFYQAVRRGERQCYLQSTLVAGMMQAAGMDAGVVMVARNEKGQTTNNGHAVALVKMSNGHDVLVDVSHKQPFIRQQGLMVADAQTGAYRYVAPQYAPTGDLIVGYAPMMDAANGTTFQIAQISGLPLGFMKSQFDYYRGERAPGGFFAKQKTNAGLIASERFLEHSIREDPNNPLPSYALGRVELRLGKKDAARTQLQTAYRLYDRYGFVPQGPRDALALVSTAAPQTLSAL